MDVKRKVLILDLSDDSADMKEKISDPMDSGIYLEWLYKECNRSYLENLKESLDEICKDDRKDSKPTDGYPEPEDRTKRSYEYIFDYGIDIPSHVKEYWANRYSKIKSETKPKMENCSNGNCECASITQQSKQTFQQAAEPLMKYLAENHHPHCTVIVSSAYAELMEGIESHSTDEFLND